MCESSNFVFPFQCFRIPCSSTWIWGLAVPLLQKRSLEFWLELHWISEKAMAPHSSTLAWKIPRTEEPGRLQSMGSWRVGHNWSDLAAAAAAGHLGFFHILAIINSATMNTGVLSVFFNFFLTFSPFDQDHSLKHHWSNQLFHFSVAFSLSCLEGPFWGMVSHVGVQIGNLLRSRSSDKEG